MEEKSVSFSVGRESLRGTLFIPAANGSLPAAVFYHGRGSSRARYLPIAKDLAEAGILTLTFDFRGCGESDGVFANQTYKNGINDAAAALKFLLSNTNLNKDRIGLCGSSFGAYVSGMILPKYPFIKSILLRAPAAYSDRFLTTEENSRTNDFFADRVNWEDSSVFDNVGKFTGALMVLKCENDELLPDCLVEKYYETAEKAGEKKLDILRGADHDLSDPACLEEFYRKIRSWFLKTL